MAASGKFYEAGEGGGGLTLASAAWMTAGLADSDLTSGLMSEMSLQHEADNLKSGSAQKRYICKLLRRILDKTLLRTAHHVSGWWGPQEIEFNPESCESGCKYRINFRFRSVPIPPSPPKILSQGMVVHRPRRKLIRSCYSQAEKTKLTVMTVLCARI